MTHARLIRRVRFTASHHYARSDWSEERNREAFGDQAASHEHDWMVEPHIVGPMDPATGFVADLAAVDGALETLLGGWDGGNLNTLVPEVADGRMQPSTESLAAWLHRRFAGAVEPPARLESVLVWESPELGARFPA
jgi:6-pyruvoyl-tetrahydropterin synthase